MSNPLESLRSELLGCGLPGRYVERLMREWLDHWQDVVDEGLDAGVRRPEAMEAATRRLGDPSELVRFAVDGFRRRSVFGRHPLASVLVTTVVGVPVAWVAFLLASLGGGLHVLRRAGVADDSAAVAMFLLGTCHVASYWVCTAFAVVCHRLGRRHGLGDRWTWTACALAALVGSFNYVKATPPQAAVPSGTVAVALSTVPDLLKLAIPLLAVALSEADWRHRRAFS